MGVFTIRKIVAAMKKPTFLMDWKEPDLLRMKPRLNADTMIFDTDNNSINNNINDININSINSINNRNIDNASNVAFDHTEAVASCFVSLLLLYLLLLLLMLFLMLLLLLLMFVFLRSNRSEASKTRQLISRLAPST